MYLENKRHCDESLNYCPIRSSKVMQKTYLIYKYFEKYVDTEHSWQKNNKFK